VTVGAVSDHLIINELDYDQLATDATEFAEIFNPTASAVDLAGYTIVLVNGATNTTYSPTADLGPAGTLPAGGYLVWGATSVVSTLPSSVLRVDAGAVTNLIQNGAPDGIALVHAGALVDALSYEGAISSATVTGITGTVSLVEGTALASSVADSNSAPGSLSRLPNGTDTDNAATDWAFTSTPTPGAPNVP
jgi:hypothetical protein